MLCISLFLFGTKGQRAHSMRALDHSDTASGLLMFAIKTVLIQWVPSWKRVGLSCACCRAYVMFTTAWGFPVRALGPWYGFRTRCTALSFFVWVTKLVWNVQSEHGIIYCAYDVYIYIPFYIVWLIWCLRILLVLLWNWDAVCYIFFISDAWSWAILGIILIKESSSSLLFGCYNSCVSFLFWNIVDVFGW